MVLEAGCYRDVIFVDGDATATRAAGPIQSLVEWFTCALRAWPQAHLIGKADDDVSSEEWVRSRSVRTESKLW